MILDAQKHVQKKSEEDRQAIRDRQYASFHAEGTNNTLAIAQNVRQKMGTTWPQLVAMTAKANRFRFDRQAGTLTCPRKYVDKFCDKLEIEYESFVDGMRRMGFYLISSTSSADMVFKCPSNFDPMDPEKILQLKVDSNATRGKGTGRNSTWGFNEIDNVFHHMNDNKEAILKVSFLTYFRENEHVINSIAEGRDWNAVKLKTQKLLGTTNTKKVFAHPLFQRILDLGAEAAIPKKEDKRKKKAAPSTNAADGAKASVLNDTSKKRKAKTTSTASTDAANGADGTVPKKKKSKKATSSTASSTKASTNGADGVMLKTVPKKKSAINAATATSTNVVNAAGAADGAMLKTVPKKKSAFNAAGAAPKSNLPVSSGKENEANLKPSDYSLDEYGKWSANDEEWALDYMMRNGH